MGEAGGTPAAAAAGAENLADLDQALGLAAAFFGGDPAVARWAASGDDADPLPEAGMDQLGLHDDAELDALMGLSGPPAQLQQELTFAVDADGSRLGGAEADAAAVGRGLDVPQPAGAEAAGSFDAAGAAAPAAPAASQLAASVGDLQLDDIDSEPSDAMAPGARLLRDMVPSPAAFWCRASAARALLCGCAAHKSPCRCMQAAPLPMHPPFASPPGCRRGAAVSRGGAGAGAVDCGAHPSAHCARAHRCGGGRGRPAGCSGGGGGGRQAQVRGTGGRG